MATGIERRLRFRLWPRAALLFLATAGVALAGSGDDRLVQTERAAVRIEILTDRLEQPWAVESLPDGGLLLTERNGQLRIWRDGILSPAMAGVPDVAVEGQGGLLDVALGRDFARDRQIFLTASQYYGDGAGTVVIRARLSADERSLEDIKVIFRMSHPDDSGRHFGSRIAVAADGSLFVTIGDRGAGMRAQDFRDHAGSVLHINPDGTIPPGNPFADGVKGAPEIWSKGHRNPQGITLDTDGRTLLTVEHGSKGGDEINRPESGRNYGWPLISFGTNYDGSKIGSGQAAPGLEQPLHYWDPSIAPGAIAVYQGAMFPEWQGNLLVAALKFQLLARLERDASGKVTSEERLLAGDYGRLRDLDIAADGSILVVTDEDDGMLLRLSRAD